MDQNEKLAEAKLPVPSRHGAGKARNVEQRSIGGLNKMNWICSSTPRCRIPMGADMGRGISITPQEFKSVIWDAVIQDLTDPATDPGLVPADSGTRGLFIALALAQCGHLQHRVTVAATPAEVSSAFAPSTVAGQCQASTKRRAGCSGRFKQKYGPEDSGARIGSSSPERRPGTDGLFKTSVTEA